MQIIIAENAGFCYGVKRTLAMAEAAVREHGLIYSYGPLIHNPQEIARLKERQVVPITDIGELPDDPDSRHLIIRSHGVAPEVIEKAEAKGLHIIDATCTLVKKVQMLARSLSQEGYQVVIVGDKDHPEVTGLLGWAGRDALVIENLEQAKALPDMPRIGVVAQTTQREEQFSAIIKVLENKTPDLKVHNTICHATEKTQKSALELLDKVDLMLVIGGKNSSNTKKLAYICASNGVPTYHLETADDIPPDLFHGVEKVGVTAGASTPDWIIEEVILKMAGIENNVVEEIKDTEIAEESPAAEETAATAEAVAAEEAEEAIVAEAATAAAEAAEEAEAAIAVEEEAAAEEAVVAEDAVATEEAEEAVMAEEAEAAEATAAAQEAETAAPIRENGNENEIEQAASEEATAEEAAAEEAPAEGEEDGSPLGEPSVDNITAAETGSQEESAGEQKFDDIYGGAITDVRRGARVKGVIVQVKPDELLVDIGGKSEGIVPASELLDSEAKEIQQRFHVGDEIEVLILRREDKEGYPVLSKRRVDQEVLWDKLEEARKEGQILTGKVSKVVKGGLLVDLGIRGFIPASLVAMGYVEDLATYVNQELKVKIIECDRGNNKLVLSAKAVLLDNSKKHKEEIWANIAIGDIRHGLVRRLTKFGAFIDLGGVDGLLHVSEMAWYRVNQPSDILKEGDEIDVSVLNLDRENEKISLGLKQLQPTPWSTAEAKYPQGSVISAKVVRLAPFGAFVEVEPGVEGLIHISQLAHERVEKTEDVVKPGDIVTVKVLAVDSQAKRISLSIKAALPTLETALPEPLPPGNEGEDEDTEDLKGELGLGAAGTGEAPAGAAAKEADSGAREEEEPGEEAPAGAAAKEADSEAREEEGPGEES